MVEVVINRKGATPDEDTLKACFIQGKQLATVATWIAAGKAAN